MNLADEFEIYDNCTADALQIGDLINYNNELIEIHSIEDNLDIEISGYSYNEDETVEHTLPYDLRVNLYKIKD